MLKRYDSLFFFLKAYIFDPFPPYPLNQMTIELEINKALQRTKVGEIIFLKCDLD